MLLRFRVIHYHDHGTTIRRVFLRNCNRNDQRHQNHHNNHIQCHNCESSPGNSGMDQFMCLVSLNVLSEHPTRSPPSWPQRRDEGSWLPSKVKATSSRSHSLCVWKIKGDVVMTSDTMRMESLIKSNPHSSPLIIRVYLSWDKSWRS